MTASNHREDKKMAENNFRSWLGVKDDSKASPTDHKISTGGSGANSPSFDRIRELESELADLRSRRDITSLSREEFEILATETAVSLIKAAQAREARAIAAAQKALSESERVAKQVTETAEAKARTALANAESRGRKYIEAAEAEAREAIAKANKFAQDLLDTKTREANALTSAAKREAERTINEATAEIGEFRNWLADVVSESERLQKIQTQALASAEDAIRNAKSRLNSAFEKLASLGTTIESALDENNRPKDTNFAKPTSGGIAVTGVKSAKTDTGRDTPLRGAPSDRSASRGSLKISGSASKNVRNQPKRK